VRLVDANLLVYAYVAESPQYAAARQWLDQQLSGVDRLGFPWETIVAFVRLCSNPRILEHSQPIADLWLQARAWLSAPAAWIPLPTRRHEQTLDGLMGSVTGHRLVHDAHLAALAIEHGLILCTADRGFARFPGLRWENPLEGK
jgi:toxin-antitoxin system PIN domain toxin